VVLVAAVTRGLLVLLEQQDKATQVAQARQADQVAHQPTQLVVVVELAQ
jgi:hypothetical protein